MSELLCSVVIPSYNRCQTLEKVLEGLERQSIPQEKFEVMVVLDGSKDGSAEMLAEWQRSGRLPNLRWCLLNDNGPGISRNIGALAARAPIILFLDDDVVPEPDLVQLHLEGHGDGLSRVLLGDFPLARDPGDPMCKIVEWSRWEPLFHNRGLPGHHTSYRDFITGNVSMRREDFVRLGGFDPRFLGYGGEDYELGYRLVNAGIPLVTDRRLRARHLHRYTVSSLLHNARREASGDLLIARKYPELCTGLRLMWTREGTYGLMIRLAMRAPAAGDIIAVFLKRILPVLEKVKLFRAWSFIFDRLRLYAYFRGVRDALGSWDALLAFQERVKSIPVQHLDISDGLAENVDLWMDGLTDVEVIYRGHCLGVVRFTGPVEEPLRPYLARLIVSDLGNKLQEVKSMEMPIPHILK